MRSGILDTHSMYWRRLLKAKKNKKPAHREAGFLLRVFRRERRNAELSYLLSICFGPAVKTRCVGPSSWLASY